MFAFFRSVSSIQCYDCIGNETGNCFDYEVGNCTFEEGSCFSLKINSFVYRSCANGPVCEPIADAIATAGNLHLFQKINSRSTLIGAAPVKLRR